MGLSYISGCLFSDFGFKTLLFWLLFSLGIDFIGIIGAKDRIVISSSLWMGALLFIEKKDFERQEQY